jgi:hypothetical protein
MHHYTVTLTAAAQSVAAALGLTATTDRPFRSLTFQPGKANTNDAFIGGAGVTVANYGLRLDPADTAPALVLGGYDSGGLKLSNVYLIGTAGEIVHILGVPF